MSESDDMLSSVNSNSSYSSREESESETSDEMEVVGHVQPYAEEPIAHTSDEEEDTAEDEDSLSPAVLRSRFEGQFPLNEWCSCGECAVETLCDALEYRCCREIPPASQKLMFDGTIERATCITKHDDFSSMNNQSVLLQVAPLLRDRGGRGYRRRGGQTENQFLRAVSYRWLVRWICGYLGWDNTRPLSACVYHYVTKKYPSAQTHGYQSAAERN